MTAVEGGPSLGPSSRLLLTVTPSAASGPSAQDPPRSTCSWYPDPVSADLRGAGRRHPLSRRSEQCFLWQDDAVTRAEW